MATEIFARSIETPPKTGTIVVAPHHFPNLDREQAIADEFGLKLLATPDVDTFRSAIRDALVVMVTPYARLTAKDFPTMRHCIAVIRYGIGYDNIDVAAARQAGIPVSIVPGTASEEVASHALAMGLSLARRLPEGDAAIRAGGWNGTVGYDTPPLSRLDVGVVGLGRIGERVARMWSALGANVTGFDPFNEIADIRQAPLDTVLIESDLVSLHVPLSDETKGLISKDRIATMRHGVVIINVSRGGLIDEVSLACALRTGAVAGAGLDTFSQEPVPEVHPLREAPNTILTPHIAWRSNRSTGALQDGAVDRVRRALTNQPLIDVVS